ncbi:hypothetical protein [Ornithinimicrobium panacihumi]|uniref:hypothetical protein n=1 Tax=Ornithinimicrobium panacihumi TaxID=2008449 RepID=UPI003F88AC0C
MKPRLITALTLSAALVLTGCAGAGTTSGVSVNGTDYSAAEVQEATAQLSEATQQQFQPQQVIASLAQLPVLDELFAGTDFQLTEATVQQTLAQTGVTDAGRGTLDAARAVLYQNVMRDPAAGQDPKVLERAPGLQQDLAEVQVEVNPRYGAWDVNSGVTPVAPSWISSSEG